MIYYGANDGTLRAADSATGKELWAYVAPEFYATLPRLRQDSHSSRLASAQRHRFSLRATGKRAGPVIMGLATWAWLAR